MLDMTIQDARGAYELEKKRRAYALATFFNKTEVNNPELAKSLPTILDKLVPDLKTFLDPETMKNNVNRLGVGISILEDWFKAGDYISNDKFKLDPVSQGMKDLAISSGMVKIKNKETIFSEVTALGVKPEDLNKFLYDFSLVLGEGLACLTPKDIIGRLFFDSTLPVGTSYPGTSNVVREMVAQKSGGKLAAVNAVLGDWMK